MSKKKSQKNSIQKKRDILIFAIVFISLIIIGAVMLLNEVVEKSDSVADLSSYENTEQFAETAENDLLNLGKDLNITAIESYSGRYVEDGSDEEVLGILSIKVVNRGQEAIEYAVIHLQSEDWKAEFTVSALLPGKEAVLLEKNKMTYDEKLDYTKVAASCENLARYQYDLKLQEEKLKLQVLDGAVNVTNISDTDIASDITIYYKNKDNGVYLGGIAYRITIEGGLAAGQISQKMAGHLSGSNSEILFVTISE